MGITWVRCWCSPVPSVTCAAVLPAGTGPALQTPVPACHFSATGSSTLAVQTRGISEQKTQLIQNLLGIARLRTAARPLPPRHPPAQPSPPHCNIASWSRGCFPSSSKAGWVGGLKVPFLPCSPSRTGTISPMTASVSCLRPCRTSKCSTPSVTSTRKGWSACAC